MNGRIADAAENALLRELAHWWGQLNTSHFDGEMRPPVLALEDSQSQLGHWDRQSRSIVLARPLVAEQPWSVVIEVLKHEMAHQYCDEVLGAAGEGPHGPTFQEVCRRLAIDASARGLPRPAEEGSERDRILRKVQRLLPLADSPEVNEAQAAMNAAHKLMLKYNLDMAEAAGERRYGFAMLGRPTKRLAAHERVLAGILGEHFFVRCVWVWAFDAETGERGRSLEICGTPQNLEIATYVHGFLLEAGARLWRDHKRRLGIRSDHERRRFLSGMMVGFHEKLQQQVQLCRQEGLVWAGDADLEDYLGARHPSLRKGRRTRMRTSAAWHHGRAAGKELVLHKPVKDEGSSRGLRIGGPVGRG